MMTKEGVIFMVKDGSKNRYLPSIESFAKSLTEGHVHRWDAVTKTYSPNPVDVFFEASELMSGHWHPAAQARFSHAVQAVLALPLPLGTHDYLNGTWRQAWISQWGKPGIAISSLPPKSKDGKAAYRQDVKALLGAALP